MRRGRAHLHVHRESAIRWETLAELAAAHGVPVRARPATGLAGLPAFVEHNQLIRDCLRRPADFARIAREFCADEAADGTGYVEVTFIAATASASSTTRTSSPRSATGASRSRSARRPTSLGFAPSIREHPIGRLVEAGLLVTVNTDIPAMPVPRCRPSTHGTRRRATGGPRSSAGSGSTRSAAGPRC